MSWNHHQITVSKQVMISRQLIRSPRESILLGMISKWSAKRAPNSRLLTLSLTNSNCGEKFCLPSEQTEQYSADFTVLTAIRKSQKGAAPSAARSLRKTRHIRLACCTSACLALVSPSIRAFIECVAGGTLNCRVRTPQAVLHSLHSATPQLQLTVLTLLTRPIPLRSLTTNGEMSSPSARHVTQPLRIRIAAHDVRRVLFSIEKANATIGPLIDHAQEGKEKRPARASAINHNPGLHVVAWDIHFDGGTRNYIRSQSAGTDAKNAATIYAGCQSFKDQVARSDVGTIFFIIAMLRQFLNEPCSIFDRIEAGASSNMPQPYSVQRYTILFVSAVKWSNLHRNPAWWNMTGNHPGPELLERLRAIAGIIFLEKTPWNAAYFETKPGVFFWFARNMVNSWLDARKLYWPADHCFILRHEWCLSLLGMTCRELGIRTSSFAAEKGRLSGQKHNSSPELVEFADRHWTRSNEPEFDLT
ncbi:hypothetical protein CCUS01_15503 [Colletotrichum cuscutae]|uniref:Uncharacterized protein n=1 Tax=Colletotrichum cuscutae TaxID=1209917 RepID=A0AAI9VEG0_9PEZI|nr:hypothetical protein CCUS01_15503 [Colletotrichum cuscutae]